MNSLPNVSVNMAMTLDGKVSRPDGRWYGLSSRNDKKRMDEIRSKAEVLILGKIQF
ncbi:riboflavin biosynthesis protein RibD C-terminal domain protein [Leptospira interrogans serovar Lora str. TE 1992]|uniref:Riboflavin biosynthesis protein RibD C-terminal domain protein n=1 Tax=Leptospira interrogans serovar Lora str. TE 1992 TaxID=1193028 RepID=M3CTY7_LEPIR|nr:riboflavin biosynthesis protein RibD C-terminal domain protein [Leptospira interrogans serovar Lora str. TE 1992]